MKRVLEVVMPAPTDAARRRALITAIAGDYDGKGNFSRINLMRHLSYSIIDAVARVENDPNDAVKVEDVATLIHALVRAHQLDASRSREAAQLQTANILGIQAATNGVFTILDLIWLVQGGGGPFPGTVIFTLSALTAGSTIGALAFANAGEHLPVLPMTKYLGKSRDRQDYLNEVITAFELSGRDLPAYVAAKARGGSSSQILLNTFSNLIESAGLQDKVSAACESLLTTTETDKQIPAPAAG